MIAELREITGHRQHLFPCMGSPRRPMSENGVNQALRRLGYGTGEMAAHGFRPTAVTLLTQWGNGTPIRSSGSSRIRTPPRSGAPMRVASIGTSELP